MNTIASASYWPPWLRFARLASPSEDNTSFLCDGETLRFAKRTSVLEEGEQFYDYPELLERYRDRVLKLFGGIKAKYPEVTHMNKELNKFCTALVKQVYMSQAYIME